jgi:hypothetical protein
MENNNIGRLYSRKNGWKNGILVKSFNSSLLDNLPPIDLQDKTGNYIYNYLKKNNLENDYEKLFIESKIYNNWYFYYGEIISITSTEGL